MVLTLTSLPNEIIIRIFNFLDSPYDLGALDTTSRKLNECSNDQLLWRHLHSRYRFSKPRSRIDNWKSALARRRDSDRNLDICLGRLVDSSEGRFRQFESIWDEGLDVKDRLLWHINTAKDDEGKGLAQRWWAKAALSGLHRRMAIDTWSKLARGEDIPLEKALGAFDVFVRDGEAGEPDDLSQKLDELAAGFRDATPTYKKLSTRELALALAQYLNARSFYSVPMGHTDYYDIRNNFIGMALERPENKGIPLIYVSTYCVIAQRLGLDAHLCAFPTHVYAIIYPPEGKDLNGKTLKFAGEREALYIDAYKQFDHEASIDTLREELIELEVPRRERDPFFVPTATIDIIRRCCRNITNCIQYERVDNRHTATEYQSMDHDSVTYLVLWATIIAGEPEPFRSFPRRYGQVSLLRNQIELNYAWDVGLFEDLIIPMFVGHVEQRSLEQLVAACRLEDVTPPTPMSRSAAINEEVKYKIGTFFKHRRYHYEATVIGWDSACAAPTLWMVQNRVDGLDNGSKQSFYHVL